MTASTRVVCTGIGLVSPLGVGAEISWSTLLKSKCGITRIKNEHSYENKASQVAAYVPDVEYQAALETQKHAYLARNSKQFSRATNFAMIAAHEALEDAELLDPLYQIKDKYRDITGTAIGQGMVDFQDIHDNGSKVFDKERTEFRRISPYFITRALVNMAAGNVSIRYKSGGPNHCVSTACATGVHSIGDAFNFIRHGNADIMICGSTEAAINSLSLAGFARLRALSTNYNDEPEAASRPFDVNRCGFVMGEGAGILILESLDHVDSRNFARTKIYGEILGYGLSSDAHHLTAPSPNGRGALRCMQSALRDAQVLPSDVTHVNAHATSTPMGDDLECMAIEELFHGESQGPRSKVTVTSCKGSIGHLLGAAGSVESVFAILSCKNSVAPPTLNLVEALQTPKNSLEFICDRPSNWSSEKRILVKNSFGFGGTNASIVMSNFIE